MDVATDRQLIMQAQQGETAVFGIIVQRYQTAVFNVAYRLLGRRRDAEDAAQEAFLRAFEALDRFDPERPFGPWVKRITVNVCLNWLDKKQVKTQISATDVARPDETPSMDRWQAATVRPEQAVADNERDARLRAAIQALPPRYRAVIELRHFQEMSYEEIAAAVQRPLSSVKSDLFRARRRLAEMLQEEASGTGEG